VRVDVIGGGPGGLFLAILLRKALPAAAVTVRERNRPGDTFGWGVVFSRETLQNLEAADPESLAAVRRSFAYWDDIDTWHRGERVVSTGHGFCGLSRKRLLEILQARAREVGAELRFEEEVPSPDALEGADCVVAADGVNSRVRALRAADFRPSVAEGAARFSWLGTTLPLRAFTFRFKESEHGLFRVHAYPFEPGLGTWILECTGATWRRAGLDRATEEETVAYAEALFREELGGHRLLANRSLWRAFPTVRCGSWRSGHTVLLGDAAHTAHFSIGSGTKLAMEDSIALARVLAACGASPSRPAVEAALAAYETERRPEVERLQRAAAVSQAWFEETERWTAQGPLELTFNLMSRSHRITFDNLRARDPALADRVREDFAARAGSPRASDGSVPAPVFTPFRLRGVTLRNRIVVSPMCMYSATDGVPGDWHLVHLGGRAVGGAGLVIAEATGVSPDGRITPGCTGLWDDAQEAAWRRIVEFARRHTKAAMGIQLAHAGRKGSCSLPWEGDGPLREGSWQTLGPSPLPFDDGWPAPREMDRRDMDRVRDAFAAAAARAARAGFDLVEVHAAHGYLLSSFLSAACNRRGDAYGGSLENRLRFPLEVLRAVRASFPADRPVAVRITGSDWLEGEEGVTPAEAVLVARAMKDAGCDLVDVSSGGNTPRSAVRYGRMYQVPFADAVRHGAGVATMAVGGILDADHANTVLAAGRADLACMARPHLRDPYLAMHAAEAYGFPDLPWPLPYAAVKPRKR
jgi:anthraniloyl-CoA monooxygenase